MGRHLAGEPHEAHGGVPGQGRRLTQEEKEELATLRTLLRRVTTTGTPTIITIVGFFFFYTKIRGHR